MTALPSRRGPLWLLPILMLFGLALPPFGFAQQRLSGRVVRAGEPVPGVAVTLHQVTRDTAGAVGAVRANAQGSFRFVLPPADSAAGFNVFFATAEHHGVRYFGPPVHSEEQPADYSIAVYDTAAVPASGRAVRLVRRDMVMFPQPDGGWEVNEVLLFANDSARTWVAPVGKPVWTFSVPNGIGAFEAGEGSVDAEQVVRMDQRVLVLAPVPPGRHQLTVRYRLAPTAARAAFALPAPADSFRLLIQQPAPPVEVDGLHAGPAVDAAGARFVQFAAGSLPAQHDIRLAWPRSAPPVDPRFAAVATAGLLLLGGVVAAFRNGKARGRQ